MKPRQVKLSDPILKPLSADQLETLSKSDLLILLQHEQELRAFYQGHAEIMEEKFFQVAGQLFRIKSKIFSPKSEKSPHNYGSSRDRKKDGPNDHKRLPSERYPQAKIIEESIEAVDLPRCKCCGEEMQDSGMSETTEYLTVIPKDYAVVQQVRHKYRCKSCHGDIQTAPAKPRVIPGSSYSDEMIVDATLSKYCDLIPMERYCKIAERLGFAGIPPHSLIETSFKLGKFMGAIYDKIKEETLNADVLLADETPHKMLEGDPKRNWFLWGFQNGKSCFYECHDTRSGDVASTILQKSSCRVLVSDVYSGYNKAIREANELRDKEGKTAISAAFCNSHARRNFKASTYEAPAEAEFMIAKYSEIYALNDKVKEVSEDAQQELRSQMQPLFEEMKSYAESQIERFSSKSQICRAFNYFLKNYEGLTLCLTNHRIPLDNNSSERLLRSPVVGRKTWYGTHSPAGAEALSVHFTLVESCKLNGVNPRAFYKDALDRLHGKKPILTPYEYRWNIPQETPTATP
jgi:transposase